MKKKATKARKRATRRPARTSYTTLRQIVQWIPAGLPDRIARDAGADIRKFSCTSHVLALLHGHIVRAGSLNEICDAARLHEPELNRIRGATAPKRNTFSNANRRRDPKIAEDFYWEMFEHLMTICPSFTQYKKHSGFIFRLKRGIFAIDSTTLKLTPDSIDRARHRRKKAAAKTHMAIDVGSRLPTFAVVEDAAHHDSTRADVLCAGLKDGDVLLADRACVDFRFLYGLAERGVFLVLREKENMDFEVLEERGHQDRRILKDQTIRLRGKLTAEKYPEPLRRVTAVVEVDGQEREMTFITNNFAWSPRTVSELYRARWVIESFFKELKQTLQLTDFVGYNENAVKWQVWIGLLAHLLLRFLKHVSKWGLSFSRLAGVVRAAVRMRIDLLDALRKYGTAGGPKRPVIVGKQLYFQGFEPFASWPVG
ncbi:MAG TPA: IS4 family transposase [Candidatus Hydrogenedentes bacterium]|nr:IS4 family transposase [Candidatus Hydrogenedentota bacterium]